MSSTHSAMNAVTLSRMAPLGRPSREPLVTLWATTPED
jgi:hypothetical protein